MLSKLKENPQRAVARTKQQADKGRSEREFKVGNCVFLKLQAYRQLTVERRRCAKLAPRYFGPYEVIAKVGKVAYTLKFPEGSRIHPTFHVSHLKRCPVSSIAPVHMPEGAELLSVKKLSAEILDRRMIQRKGRPITEVLVHWQGETSDDASWEIWHSLTKEFPSFVKELHLWGQGYSEGGNDMA